MYNTDNFCCLCLCNKSEMKLLIDVDNYGVSCYYKLTSSIAEMNIEEVNNQRLICGECCGTLNTVYDFRQMCLRNKTQLIQYVLQLQTSSHFSAVNNVPLKDIKIEKIDNESQYENNETSKHYEHILTPQSSNDKDVIHAPVSIKKEYGSDEDSSAHENAIADHVNEGAHSDVKVKVEHQTMMEDEYATNNTEDVIENPMVKTETELNIEEFPFIEVKNEYIETPQDGSTCLDNLTDIKLNKPTSKSKESDLKTDEKIFECELCHKKFSEKSYLKKHMRFHSDERPHECEICKRKFIFKKHLTEHMRIHSGERPYECEICKKSFIKKSSFDTHMKIHSGEKSYECNICHKKFTQKCHLTRHTRSHGKERPFECEICKKKFADKGVLKEHVRIHSGKRPYECHICHKNFIQKSNLTAHVLLHSGERTYECEICMKKFMQKGVLTTHMRVHSGERPYPCEMCPKKYITHGKLKEHMRKHTGERPYECTVCQMKFLYKGNLNEHMKRHSADGTKQKAEYRLWEQSSRFIHK